MDSIINSATATALRANYRTWLTARDWRTGATQTACDLDQFDPEFVISLAAQLSTADWYAWEDAALDFADRPSTHRARAARQLVKQHLPANLRGIETDTLYAWQLAAEQATYVSDPAKSDAWWLAYTVLRNAYLLRELGYYRY